MPQSAAAAADRCRCAPCPVAVTVTRALALVAVAGVVGALHSIARPVQVELRAPAPVPTHADPAPQAPAIDAADVPVPSTAATLDVHISLAQARSLYESGETDFIDAREPFEYEPSHIPGAYNLTQADFAGGKAPPVLEFLDPARPVVIYCGGGTCHASENVAILLQQAGFTSIHIMTDGFPAWTAAGYETDAGPDPLKSGETP